MQRQIALDTETTGKDEETITGEHRIIEIGCVEILNRKLTGRDFRVLLNPMRPIDEEASQVHGITDDMLTDKPQFKDIASEFLDFITGAELLIHNAKFDCAFLNRELMLMGMSKPINSFCTVTDTLSLARSINPNHQANLDNLCRIYDVDRSARTKHGALLDAQLLAEVYLAMTGGQASLEFGDLSKKASLRRWSRPEGAVLPRMQVDATAKAVHIDTMISLSQGKKFTQLEDGTYLSGSLWSDDFAMDCLEKGKEESKKDYAKRLGEQKQMMLDKLLSREEQELLLEYIDNDKKAHALWESRVKAH